MADQSVQSRQKSAIIGSVVADAAGVPLHWFYDVKKLDEVLEGRSNPEFREPSANPFYDIPTGSSSLYGDQALAMLESLVESNGLDTKDYAERLYKQFGPGTEYDNPENAKHGTDQDMQLPIKGPWKPQVIKHFEANFIQKKAVTGSEVKRDMHAVCIVPPLVAKYAGDPDLLLKVKSAVEVTTVKEEAAVVAMAATRLLEHYVLHGSDEKAVDKVIAELKNPDRRHPQAKDAEVADELEIVLQAKEKSNREVAGEFGRSCNVPDAFKVAVHALITKPDYTSAIRSTLYAGGDCVSRAGFVGACKAAQNGVQVIPEDWKTKTFKYKKALELTDKLVK
ncbi:crystallin J1C-like isoform X2 [Ptychodera flava]|uniref:crystallin J1C-like isoform X2 n=1 Tax=Ptychodera flava TaxID=63121 RepID=UPI003969F120